MNSYPAQQNFSNSPNREAKMIFENKIIPEIDEVDI